MKALCTWNAWWVWMCCGLLAVRVAVAQENGPPPGLSGKPLQVGSKPFTESVILGESIRLLLQQSGIPTAHRAEMGTRVLYDALRAGEIDVYPEYTGTLRTELLANHSIRDDAALRAALAAEGIVLGPELGFNNTYALGMKRKLAEELGLKKLSDLARTDDPRIASLRLGFSDEFFRRNDGWPGLKVRYRLLHPAVAMNHSLAYQGIESGILDVTDLFSTDAEIASYDLVVLQDDLGYFPVYQCVLLYREDLQTRSPQAVAALQQLAGQIDNAHMVDLNARVQLERQPEGVVAAEFLNSKLGLQVPIPKQNRWARIGKEVIANTWRHLWLVTISLAGAIVMGIPLGMAAARHSTWGHIILGITGLIQTMPSLAVLVFLIPILGLGAPPAICALFLYSLLPITRGTYSGLKEVPATLHESASVLGLSGWAKLRLIELPLAARSILTGIKTAAVINVGTATIGGMIGAGGYGQPIMTGIRLADPTLLLQGAIPAALLALLVQYGFEWCDRLFIPAGLRLATAK